MNRLRQYRTSLGLSQSALAARMRVPIKTLQNWEQGRTPVPGLVDAWIDLAEQDSRDAMTRLVDIQKREPFWR